MKHLTQDEIKKHLVNLSLHDRKSDNFYLTFLGLPENIANVLSRQVLDSTRPDISFEFSQVNHRGNVYKDKSFLRFEPLNLTFADDENSIVSHILFGQIFRQLNKHPDIFGNIDNGVDREFRFGMRLDLLNSTDTIVEAYQFDKCFISSLNHSDPSIKNSEDSTIQAVVQYENMSVLTFGEWMQFLETKSIS